MAVYGPASVRLLSLKPLQSRQAWNDRSASRQVTPGNAFSVGKHKTVEGWSGNRTLVVRGTDRAMGNVPINASPGPWRVNS